MHHLKLFSGFPSPLNDNKKRPYKVLLACPLPPFQIYFAPPCSLTLHTTFSWLFFLFIKFAIPFIPRTLVHASPITCCVLLSILFTPYLTSSPSSEIISFGDNQIIVLQSNYLWNTFIFVIIWLVAMSLQQTINFIREVEKSSIIPWSSANHKQSIGYIWIHWMKK